MVVFVANSFLAAFLLFQIQPLVGKLILPTFGGASSVWNACLLFFQVSLLAGYGYALALLQLPRARQAAVHLTVMAAAVGLLLFRHWQIGEPTRDPVLEILWVLTSNIGIPVFLLAATSPLLQSWYRHTHHGHSPYRLYAYSNCGSLLGLVSYPFLVERFLSSGWQTFFWRGGFVVYAILLLPILLNVLSSRKEAPSPAEANTDEETRSPTIASYFWWVCLSGCGVCLLLSTTDQICRHIAPIPLLWVLPLVIYLLTFIITFQSERWYNRTIFGMALIVAVIGQASVWVLAAEASFITVAAVCISLFVGCMVCHGELVSSKPDARHLGHFYLAISLGGALGGTFVAFLAPMLFDEYVENGISLFACCLLILVAFRMADWQQMAEPEKRREKRNTAIRLGTLTAVFATLSLVLTNWVQPETVLRQRNFFGVVMVRTFDGPVARKELVNAGTVHGVQATDPERSTEPTSYYGPDGGCGLAIRNNPGPQPSSGIKIGAIGMGVGTVCAYLSGSDEIRFYEINPAITRLAETEFTFLADARKRGVSVSTVIGDARIELSRELSARGGQAFDVLVVDAFSGDSVPVHLLTKECFEIYWKHVKPNGILAIHISNRLLGFEPVLRAQQLRDEVPCAVVRYRTSNELESASDWVLFSKNQAFFDHSEIKKYVDAWKNKDDAVEWTDDYSSIVRLLRLW